MFDLKRDYNLNGVDTTNINTYIEHLPILQKIMDMGYRISKYSDWSGDIGKFTIEDGQYIGFIDVLKKEIKPIHGYYGGYLSNIAKKIKYSLVE